MMNLLGSPVIDASTYFRVLIFSDRGLVFYGRLWWDGEGLANRRFTQLPTGVVLKRAFYLRNRLIPAVTVLRNIAERN